jgi:hypothetical protein
MTRQDKKRPGDTRLAAGGEQLQAQVTISHYHRHSYSVGYKSFVLVEHGLCCLLCNGSCPAMQMNLLKLNHPCTLHTSSYRAYHLHTSRDISTDAPQAQSTCCV